MTTANFISYLRTSLFIQDSDIKSDPEYITLTDSFLEMTIEVCTSRLNALASFQLGIISQEILYPLSLLCKKDIYTHLSTKTAPLYDLSIGGSSGSSSLKKASRFDHYFSLIKQVEEEYKNWSTDTSNIVLSTENNVGSLSISNKGYNDNTNYSLSKRPIVLATLTEYVDSIAYISFSYSGMSADKFLCFEVYKSNSSIVNIHDNYSISTQAVKVEKIYDIHDLNVAIETEVNSFVCIICRLKNGLIGFSELFIADPSVSGG